MIPELLIMLGLEKTKWCFNALTITQEPDKYGVFIDKNGTQRMLPSLRKVIRRRSNTGEDCLFFINGQLALNISLEQARENKEIAEQNGETFYVRCKTVEWKPCTLGGHPEILGDRYCKINEPDKYYIKRKYIYSEFDKPRLYSAILYLDMNFNIVSITDEHIYTSDPNIKTKAINYFNEYKTKYINNALTDKWKQRENISLKKNVDITKSIELNDWLPF